MRRDGKKTPKGSRAKKAAVKNQTVKDLTVKDAKAVKGGIIAVLIGQRSVRNKVGD